MSSFSLVLPRQTATVGPEPTHESSYRPRRPEKQRLNFVGKFTFASRYVTLWGMRKEVAVSLPKVDVGALQDKVTSSGVLGPCATLNDALSILHVTRREHVTLRRLPKQ